jgi:hypothetical protein
VAARSASRSTEGILDGFDLGGGDLLWLDIDDVVVRRGNGGLTFYGAIDGQVDVSRGGGG